MHRSILWWMWSTGLDVEIHWVWIRLENVEETLADMKIFKWLLYHCHTVTWKITGRHGHSGTFSSLVPLGFILCYLDYKVVLLWLGAASVPVCLLCLSACVKSNSEQAGLSDNRDAEWLSVRSHLFVPQGTITHKDTACPLHINWVPDGVLAYYRTFF